MKKRLIIFPAIGLCLILSYFLFEPIVLAPFGKKEMPQTANLLPVQNHTDSLGKQADEILKYIYPLLKSPAVSVAVSKKGQVVWANAIGYKDVDKKKLADLQTQFRIGSTSKTLTSAGVGLLLQDNKLELDETINTYLPTIDPKLGKITVRQLASHTSGIRNYGTCLCFPIWEYFNNDEYASIKASLTQFEEDELLFQPGESFSYSSYNYTALSAVMEGASGKGFLEFMNEEVFDVLNLKSTEAELANGSYQNLATFYSIDEGVYQHVYSVNNSNKWAGGGFISTPSDLATFGAAMMRFKLVDSVTSQILFEPVKLDNGEVNKQNYAIGWRNDQSDKLFEGKKPATVIHHGGTAMGSTSLLILIPEHDVSVSILMNRSGWSGGLFDAVYAFARLYIDEN